jgi:hypothetical protein
MYYASTLTLIIAIIIGIANYKSLKKLKLIFLILILSFIQIFFTEFSFLILNNIIPNIKEKWKSNAFIITNVYTFLEFTLILAFFKSVNKNQNSNNTIIILFFIGVLTYIAPLFTNEYNGFVMLKYFSFSSGITILLLCLFQIKKLLKNYDFEKKDEIEILIISIGIFLSNLILWPTLVIQSIVHINFNRFYDLLVISNSSGYIVLHLFSSIAFYGKNKSRIY